MALTAQQSLDARKAILTQVLIPLGPVNVMKSEIDTVTAALTTWLETNATSFNAAIAGTALAGASAATKAKCLALTAIARYG